MRNTFLILLFIFTLNSTFAINTNDSLRLNNVFKELTIRYQYGDEYYTVEEMKFVNNGDKIIATISKPDNNLLENSEMELTKKDISSLDEFLTKAYDFKDTCTEKTYSSYVNYYFLNIDGKEFTIHRFCNWENSTYINLKQQIFGTYLKNLDEKRKQLNLENNELLIGSWKYDFSIHKIEKDKIYTLTRIENKSHEKCFLRFIKEQKLIDYNCLKDSKTNYDFRFDIIDKDLILYINGVNKNDRKDFVYGYVFKVIQLNKNEIKLTPMK